MCSGWRVSRVGMTWSVGCVLRRVVKRKSIYHCHEFIKCTLDAPPSTSSKRYYRSMCVHSMSWCLSLNIGVDGSVWNWIHPETKQATTIYWIYPVALDNRFYLFCLSNTPVVCVTFNWKAEQNAVYCNIMWHANNIPSPYIIFQRNYRQKHNGCHRNRSYGDCWPSQRGRR